MIVKQEHLIKLLGSYLDNNFETFGNDLKQVELDSIWITIGDSLEDDKIIKNNYIRYIRYLLP